MDSAALLRTNRSHAKSGNVVGALLVLAISWFYLWTVVPGENREPFDHSGNGYYNLLGRGFCRGQLSLDVIADPVLATVKHPYDPTQRGPHGMHDVTYFNGKYYLYFGVTPALVFFVPVRLLTGIFVDESYAVLFFSLAGFWLSLAVMRQVRLRWFPACPAWISFLTILALGLATLVPSMLRRASFWEVPISCAYAFFMATLFCVVRAMTGDHRRMWLLAASVMMGLCVGARPTYLAATPVLLAPLLATYRKPWRRRENGMTALCIVAPIAAIGVGLATYNFLRFGRISEFGWSYMLAGNDNSTLRMLSLPMLVWNLKIYLLSVAGFSPFFPFVTVIHAPLAPYGHLGVENPYGLLVNEPWIWCAVGVIWVVCARGVRRDLRSFCVSLLLAAVGMLLLVSCFCFAANRYQIDFTPGWMLLGCIGATALAERVTGFGKWIFNVGIAALAGWSAIFGVLVSLQHNGLLRVEHPTLYARVAHAFNQPSHWLDQLAGTEYGPVELTLTFSNDPKLRGQTEPLVVTGHEFFSDFVYVHYLDDGTVRFGFEHTSRGGAVGAPLKIDFAATHILRVDMGSLYPPAAHPWFDGMFGADQRLRQRLLRVTLDGRVVLEEMMSFYDAVERSPHLGTADGRWSGRQNFSGRILSSRRLAVSSLEMAPPLQGKLRMRLRLPAFTRQMTEPLLSSGESGQGDLIFITYLDGNHVSFGHDRWRYGGSGSPPIEVDFSTEHVIEISCPPLLGANAPDGLRVRMDGREVFTAEDTFYQCLPDTVAVGVNEIGASTAMARFTGEILSKERVSP